MQECTACAGAYSAAISETEDRTCPATGFQRVSVCVPVTVTPFARSGRTVTKCCGDATVVEGDKPCPGKKNDACSFTISQTICVEVPIEFGAVAAVGDTFVNCMGASAEDICHNCSEREF